MMTKFVYRMQNILDIKIKLENQEKIAFGLANAKLAEEQEKLQKILVQRAGYERQARELMKGTLHVQDIRECRRAIDTMKSLQRTQMMNVHAAEKNVELTRKRLNDVMIERKTHEKLREKAFEQFKKEIAQTEGKTKPPAPFNEATLLSAMENPVVFMESDDKVMAKTLGETGGLGTVATRADIIEKLFNSFMIEKRGKDIYLTSKAKQLLELVPEDLKKPELTADWEMKLSHISKGQIKRNVFMKEIVGYTEELIDEIKDGEGTFRHDNLTNHKCPRCGKRMLAVNGKNSEMLVCQDRECGYRETVAKKTNARCPNCHKKMQLRGKGDGQIFVCSCGHKEKLTAFQERRKKEGAGVSKRDVQNYLKKQKEEPMNNAFADAFAKIKL